MGRQKKYNGLYGRQEAYLKTDKGKQALKKYKTSDKGRTKARDWARKKRGTIVDKQQWFIDNYGDPEKVLAILNDEYEREAIELYYGLTGSEPINQTAIARILKKSQPQVSQMLRDARKLLASLQQSASEPSQELEEARSQS